MNELLYVMNDLVVEMVELNLIMKEGIND